MSPRLVTLIVFLILSLIIGAGVGEWFFRLFLSIVPPATMSNFNTASARVAHLTYGLGVGVLMFVWVLIGTFSSRLMRSKKS
jgi:hypothetical protein